MIRQVLPVLVLLALAGPASATVLLNESHGSTWVSWDWNVTELAENQVLIGRYDGTEAVNLSSASTRPLITSYRVSGIDPNEPHVFDLILLNTSTDPATVEDTASSTARTGQSQENYLLFLGSSLALTVVGLVLARGGGRVIAMLLFVAAFLSAGYVAAAQVGTNPAVSLYGILLGVLAIAALIFTFLDEYRARSGWGDYDD